MKVAFLVNDKNMVSIMESYLSEKETFGDDVKILIKGQHGDLSDYLVIEDEFSKKDSLILDLVGNYSRHGLPSNPRVRSKKEKQTTGTSEASPSVCPNCFEVTRADICPACGEELIKTVDIDEVTVEEIEKKNNLKLVSKLWFKENHTTKKGYTGTLFLAKLHGENDTLFKFCSRDSINEQIEFRRFMIFSDPMNNKFIENEKHEIINTAYGKWISGRNDSSLRSDVKKILKDGRKLAPFNSRKVIEVYK